MAQVNNDIYEKLGQRWYTANDDPVALLRAESRLRNPWVDKIIREKLGAEELRVLDVGCGAGFLSNFLAQKNYRVSAVDLSEQSLKIAEGQDTTKSVHYQKANARELPFKDHCFDVVTAMDFLEHVDRPQMYIHEMARVLRRGGFFFFHTFNRNFISWLVGIKAVEIFIKNTPRDMHVIELFIKPAELKKYCAQSGLDVQEIVGSRPDIFKGANFWSLLKGVVPTDFSFSFTKSTLIGYSGYAVKK